MLSDRFSQRALEERRGDEQRADAEDEEEEQVVLNGGEAAVFEQDGLEAVDYVSEGVNDGDGAESGRKGNNGIYGAGGIKEKHVENAKHGAGHKRIVDADHQEKHHAVEGDGGDQDKAEEFDQGLGMEDDAQAGDERTNDGERDAGKYSLDGAGRIEAED